MHRVAQPENSQILGWCMAMMGKPLVKSCLLALRCDAISFSKDSFRNFLLSMNVIWMSPNANWMHRIFSEDSASTLILKDSRVIAYCSGPSINHSAGAPMKVRMSMPELCKRDRPSM